MTAPACNESDGKCEYNIKEKMSCTINSAISGGQEGVCVCEGVESAVLHGVVCVRGGGRSLPLC